MNSLSQTTVKDKARKCFIILRTLLDLPSTFSLLEYPSLVPDLPSAVCGRSLVLLPKDISAQIGQNKVQIWHIMARGDLQRASFERKWEFSTFGFDTDVILGIPLQIVRKQVFQKKSRIQNIFWTCCVFLLEDNVWHFCTLSNAQKRRRCCTLWSTKGLNSEHTQHANVIASFWFQTISHRKNISHRNCTFSILISCHFLEHFSTRLSFAIGGVVCDRPVAIWQVRPHNPGVALHYIANKPASQQYTARSS